MTSPAESAVLGACLLEHDAVWDCIDVLIPEDFFAPQHRVIWGCVIGLTEGNRSADLLTVGETLRADGNLDRAGGMVYLSNLVDQTPDPGNVRHYAEIVRAEALRRRLGELARRVVAETQTATPVDGILDRLQGELLEIAGRTTSKGPRSLGELAAEAAQHTAALRAGAADAFGLRTGIEELDTTLGGFRPKLLYLLAARPSIGKSALAGQIAAHAAGRSLRSGRGVYFAALEMSAEAITHRILAAESRVNVTLFVTGGVADSQQQAIESAAARLREAPLHIDDSPTQTVTQIRAKARRIQAEHGLGLVVIDYLQLIDYTMAGRTRNEEVAAISRGLKALAKEIDAPVLAVSQLSRAPEMRGDGRPRLADLRDSGAIEQDADVVMFLWRPAGDDRTAVVLDVAKNREGPLDSIPLRFDAEHTRFSIAPSTRQNNGGERQDDWWDK